MMSMQRDDLAVRVGLGAAAGLVGTAVLQGLLAANQKYAPRTMPPMRGDPGRFMVEHAEELLPEGWSERVPEGAERAVSSGLGLGYGMTFGALSAAAGSGVGTGRGSVVARGTALGLAAWAAGYLGWLPATGLMPPVWKQRPAQVAGPIVGHALFGIVTVAAYDLMRGWARQPERSMRLGDGALVQGVPHSGHRSARAVADMS